MSPPRPPHSHAACRATPAALLQPPGLAVADDDDGEHVDRVLVDTVERGDVDALALPTEIAGDDRGAVVRPVFGKDRPCLGQPAAALPRCGVVERHHEVDLGGGPEPARDRRPRCQQIGERDRAEIVADRRAGAGGGGLERADAGLHRKLDAAPALVDGLAVQQLEEERGHAVDAGIAR